MFCKVQSAKLKEQERHNEELEKIARGGNLDVKNAIKQYSKMQTHLSDNDKRHLKNTLYNLADHVSITKQGEGLFLNPYKKSGMGLTLNPHKNRNKNGCE